MSSRSNLVQQQKKRLMRWTVWILAREGPSRRRVAAFVVFSVVVLALPVIIRTPYGQPNMILIGIYTIITLGLCLLMGYAGQASLGQAAFVAIGAYGSAFLTMRFSLPPLLAMAFAAAVTAVVAWLVGMPILRLKGHYLAMGTLAFGVAVSIALREARTVTGGPSGMAGIAHFSFPGFTIKGDLAYYYLVWVVALAALILALNVVDSRFGRALRAIRSSEAAAESLGVEIGKTKLIVFILAATYASVAGSLYAHYMTFISPAAFALDVSIRVVLMAAVGGLASIWGAPFGAATVILLTLGLREFVEVVAPEMGGEYQSVAYGILLVVIMIFMPEGVTVTGIQKLRSLARSWHGNWWLDRIGRIAHRHK